MTQSQRYRAVLAYVGTHFSGWQFQKNAPRTVEAVLEESLALVADKRLQFRLEVFNLFDRANFAVPNRAVFAGATQNDPILPTAGQITRTTNTSRQLQLSAKIVF